jgi:hypothetical protein
MPKHRATKRTTTKSHSAAYVHVPQARVPAEQIASMMVSAIESGDPVTSAMKGGWCWGIYYTDRHAVPPPTPGRNWYEVEELYESPNFQIEVVEVADEDAFRWDKTRDIDVTRENNLKSGALKSHIVRRADLERGLAVMAKTFPHIFAQVLQDNTDAPCADIFLQSVLFGEEKYA